MNRWSWFLYAGRKAFSRSSWERWAGVVVGSLALASVLGGFVLLVMTAAAWNTPDGGGASGDGTEAGNSIVEVSVRVLIGLALIGVGVNWMAGSIWKVAALGPSRKQAPPDRKDILLINELGPTAHRLPTVPPAAGVLPGDVLAYRLVGRNPDWGWMIGAAVSSLVSVGMLTVLGWSAYHTYSKGVIDGWVIGAALCCIPVAAWSVYRFFVRFLGFVAFGPTRLEISSYPLFPGQVVDVFLRQPGQIRLQLLEVVLICEESVTYSQGTNIRTEVKRVVEQRLFRQRGVEVAEPFQCQFGLTVPADAMHSFAAENNRVQWTIIVSASIRGWPRFERDFPIIVQPLPS
ncbi:MAG TPA: hypothetical protein PKD54_02455 [Pirellulaceae bacterium]|nr:hypothetical protein [Pirellulaceae bacterium]